MKEELLPPLLEEDRMLAGLAYPFWFLTAWMTLLSEKREEPFLRFNCIQAIVFGISSTIGFILFVIISTFLFRIIPFLASFGFGTLMALLYLALGILFMALIALMMFYAYRASQGVFFHVPFISRIVDRLFYGPEEKEQGQEFDEIDMDVDISEWK
ncbi:MAG: DUF4870 domain-containing protein [Chloroflexi bacterium]|nr:DUF4870 domain-containing protein [Chloroflexota bacterium]